MDWSSTSTWDMQPPENLDKTEIFSSHNDEIKNKLDTIRMLHQAPEPPPQLPLPFNVFQSRKEYISSNDRITIINSK
ncbi:hypothetical protein TVAG_178050 [Trichomonas vaginalis G3]|uniref:Uncharacterized protein n=1 Tax=Trichomonas vaginalis (strain ATCC PRA-98 / G3) TaxID=412133 RepID=A2DIF7_TRIV3|nr:hypothetical protein TVAGG3_0601240 [Trichomonas vaginalis G3]EAY19761.1 hypothetical protein TVAG_178050 [Trichomonas vaginalis G3]KAI5523942.1 hypothetical protein TVAGG3_0601240 [Trichomonas vaginalis G3]|eukprot:XP_001580747.1 hypothetical protein [Trichomonas vaginalis G3]